MRNCSVTPAWFCFNLQPSKCSRRRKQQCQKGLGQQWLLNAVLSELLKITEFPGATAARKTSRPPPTSGSLFNMTSYPPLSFSNKRFHTQSFLRAKVWLVWQFLVIHTVESKSDAKLLKYSLTQSYSQDLAWLKLWFVGAMTSGLGSLQTSNQTKNICLLDIRIMRKRSF